ncbi:Tetratricopeptide repeat-containing protein [Tenacibaculum sp. MAR_2009_124]|uniref:tetratricopeptide repeat-containing sensor histidine kinase n=1 Tax=Tenacibaculum sp. MAR_2009_124 TaxID=1250059 RepID=UPI0008962E38|nr:histidine kinase [Tenacibaculum sp. MAR_2009_124]SEC41310.1 Tetratricopeptide repeat-containing protein [Tenacibaculum sp. MAR_2009_124]
MNKTFCLLLFCIAIACKEKVNKTQGKPPSFYFLKSKDGLSKDSLQFYANKIQAIDTSEISDSLKAEYAFMTGRFYYKLKDYDGAILHFDKATSFTKKITNNRQVLHFRALIAVYRRKKQDYLNASGVNEKLLHLIDSTDYKNLAFVYTNKYQINRTLAKYNEASENNLIAAKLYLKANDTINYLIATLDNAVTYSRLEKANKAHKELMKVIPYQHLMNKSMKYQFHATEGYVYNQKNKYKEAINSYKKSLSYSKTSSKSEVVNAYLNLSTTYLKLNSLRFAEKYVDSIFNLGLEGIDFTDKKEALKNALEVDYLQQKGIENLMPKLDSLLSYLEKSYDQRINNELHVLNESFENERKLQKEKNEAQIESLTFERNQYILLVLLLVLIVAGTFILNFYRQRKFKIEKQNFLLQQRLLRSQMNPHFIFNSLSLIKQSVTTNTEQYSKYIVKLSRLLRTVFDNSTQDFVALEDELTSLQDYIELQQFRFPDRFSYKINNQINTNTELFVPPMLLQPFAENAIIHAFGGLESKGHLEISLKKEKNYLVCIIDDNGKGFEKQTKKKQSSVYLIDQFLLKMTGEKIKMTNKSDHLASTGTIIELKIPYTEL